MTAEEFQKILPTIPDRPGVYRFIDKQQIPIYVGKAKSLRKRVNSYFLKNLDRNKTAVMVKMAATVEFTVVDTEQDALLLENSLIKKHQPRYNVSLKDDKSYPFICLKKERFPRIFMTRKLIRDGSEYFGPYTTVGAVQNMLDFIKTIFPLRNCTLNLLEENIRKKKFRVCLEYHIGNCKGPCEGFQSEEDYMNSIGHIRSILKGQTQPVVQYLKGKMNAAAADFKFEEAEQYKYRLEQLIRYQGRSTVVNPNLDNVDVFSYYDDDPNVYINYLKVINGSITQTRTIEALKKIDEEREELLAYVIADMRNNMSSNAQEIIVPFALDYPDKEITVTVPQRGDKQKLLELANKNLIYYKNSKNILKEEYYKMPPQERILRKLQTDFRLKELPVHIECFDNSNLQGSFPVASMVCFKNGRPSKKEYRHFNIKTVTGPDDFASMREIVYRRYRRLLDEEQPLPNLVLIDGGKGQLSAAMESLQQLGLEGKVAIAGIAKRLEEIYFPGDPLPLYVDKKSESLRLIQQIRDEAHRFAITFHRSKRQKGTIKSTLTEIDGIGKQTFEKLIKHFRSVKKLQEATREEIAGIVGESKADIITGYFTAQKNSNNKETDQDTIPDPSTSSG